MFSGGRERVHWEQMGLQRYDLTIQRMCPEKVCMAILRTLGAIAL